MKRRGRTNGDRKGDGDCERGERAPAPRVAAEAALRPRQSQPKLKLPGGIRRHAAPRFDCLVDVECPAGRDRQRPRPRPERVAHARIVDAERREDRKSTRLNSSHTVISYAVFCLKKKKKNIDTTSTL